MSDFEQTDILSIAPGVVAGTGGKYRLVSNENTSLLVTLYDASGNFVTSRTFLQDNLKQATDPEFKQYYVPYEGLSIAGVDNTSGLQVNLQACLEDMATPQGVYHIVTNMVFYIDEALKITTISTDRTEVQFSQVPGNSDTDIFFGDNSLPQHLGQHKIDIGQGRSRTMINWVADNDTIITKLDSALPSDVFAGGFYSLYMNITDPVKNIIEWETIGEGAQYNYLAPNFDIKVRSGTPATTEFKTSNDLTGTVKETKDKLVNRYLSQSYGETEVNIDYQKPEEFIHFSSYEERLLNFKYKLQLIEKYASEISASDTITGDVSASDAVALDRASSVRAQDEVISTFDRFEQYMYNASSSHVSGTLGEYWSNAWPKNTSIEPHRIFEIGRAHV